ncbi:MAG: ribose 5-phosphate isomerase B [Bacteroidales bacterium]
MTTTAKPIAICNDHAGYDTKQAVIAYLESEGLTYTDYGTYTTDSCDYPDFAHPCAQAVEDGISEIGIAICGSGNGIAMTLNKHQGIRAALCWDTELALMARAHNNANILVMPGRYISNEKAIEILKTYLSTPFEGGRHQARIDKIAL